MYHIAGLVDPPAIMPGHFFTLHPKILPTVITFLYVFEALKKLFKIITIAFSPNISVDRSFHNAFACANTISIEG